MRVLITGAHGLVGQTLARYLVANTSHNVILTSSSYIGANIPTGATFVQHNLLEQGVKSLLDWANPHAVVHCAAIGSPDACEKQPDLCNRLNAEIPKILAQETMGRAVKLIHLSTDFIFDGNTGMYTEDDAPRSVCLYGSSKLESERNVLKYNSNALVVRTALVFGMLPNLARTNILQRVVEALKRGDSFRVPIDQVRTPTWSWDLARGITLLLESSKSGIFHIAGDTQISVAHFAMLIAQVFSLNSSLLIPVLSQELNEPAPRPLRTGLRVEKMEQQLGFKATPLAHALQWERVSEYNYY